ncbi:MAG TPA: sigma-70 family RNA polymerase sigma factor [Gemmatimonadaceae bacterium]|nr:sigma-70 family RNA polymerase sigma factor [Gemmatimonadaceae bacterium]
MQGPDDIAREQQLATDFRNGDDSAFTVIYETYFDPLCRSATQWVSIDDAQDIVQGVFTYIYIARERWIVRGSLRSYLFGAVHNRARGAARRSTMTVSWDDEHIVDTIAAMPHTTTVAADQAVILTELEHVLVQSFTSCSPRMQTALRLAHRYHHYSQIARIMGISRSTVSTLIIRGRKRIRVSLALAGFTPVPQPQKPTRPTRDALDRAAYEVQEGSASETAELLDDIIDDSPLIYRHPLLDQEITIPPFPASDTILAALDDPSLSTGSPTRESLQCRHNGCQTNRCPLCHQRPPLCTPNNPTNDTPNTTKSDTSHHQTPPSGWQP